ncbi:hypothetical protein ACJMK2_040168 [Sinanodonta woodiana]|uniref:Uncharacterized protein n=1 Tax=Sinanodonta woodiana TaxID=1069815 RepID=A0ABD3WED9_SINWO
MEYCPEIAVLHSAFALISKQARAQLKLINKYEAKSYCSIITAAVREITAGLQSDLCLADSDAWHQKLHALIQYKLIKSQNTEKDAVTEETEMLVYSNLDMLAAILPEFSGPFYFELVKDNSWYQHFFQSLLLHEASIGGSLLQHALEHCQSKPVDIYDRYFISAMMDFVVSAVLTVPAELSPLVLSAVKLKPVCSPSSLFMEFLHERKHFIADIVNFQCEAATYYKSESHQRQYLKCLGQLMFLGIVGILWRDEKESLSLWIVRNLLKSDSCRSLLPKDEVVHGTLHVKCANVERLDSDRYSMSSEDRDKEVGHTKLGTDDIVDILNRNYVLHTTLNDLLSEDFPTNVWTCSLCRCLMLSEVSDINALNPSDMYQGLSDIINEPLIWITDHLYIETGKVMKVMSGVITKISVGRTSGVEGKDILRIKPSPIDTDLTIGALMWRIHEKLFFYKAVLDEFISLTNQNTCYKSCVWKIWLKDRRLTKIMTKGNVTNIMIKNYEPNHFSLFCHSILLSVLFVTWPLSKFLTYCYYMIFSIIKFFFFCNTCTENKSNCTCSEEVLMIDADIYVLSVWVLLSNGNIWRYIHIWFTLSHVNSKTRNKTNLKTRCVYLIARISLHIIGSWYAKQRCPYEFVFIVGTISMQLSEEERNYFASAQIIIIVLTEIMYHNCMVTSSFEIVMSSEFLIIFFTLSQKKFANRFARSSREKVVGSGDHLFLDIILLVISRRSLQLEVSASP